jgi:hypothetical protein
MFIVHIRHDKAAPRSSCLCILLQTQSLCWRSHSGGTGILYGYSSRRIHSIATELSMPNLEHRGNLNGKRGFQSVELLL